MKSLMTLVICALLASQSIFAGQESSEFETKIWPVLVTLTSVSLSTFALMKQSEAKQVLKEVNQFELNGDLLPLLEEKTNRLEQFLAHTKHNDLSTEELVMVIKAYALKIVQ